MNLSMKQCVSFKLTLTDDSEQIQVAESRRDLEVTQFDTQRYFTLTDDSLAADFFEQTQTALGGTFLFGKIVGK